MKNKISKQIKDMFEIFQNDQNTSIGKARNKIVDIFFDSENGISSTEIFDILKEEKQIITKATVFKIMKNLCFYKIANSKKDTSGEIIYTHDHLEECNSKFKCIKCGKIQNIDIDHNELFNITGKGFSPITMFNHNIIINGLCNECKPERACVPLLNIKENTVVTIFEIHGDSFKIKRLSDMGIKEGEKLEVLNSINNSLIIKVKENRMSISQTIAKDILVISNR